MCDTSSNSRGNSTRRRGGSPSRFIDLVMLPKSEDWITRTRGGVMRRVRNGRDGDATGDDGSKRSPEVEDGNIHQRFDGGVICLGVERGPRVALF
jgi:hypothetical protein